MTKKNILVVSETIDIDSSSAGKGRVAFIQSLIKCNFSVDVLHFSQKEIDLPSVKTVLIKENRADPYYWLSRGQRVIQRLTGKNFSRSLENKFGFSFTFKNDAASIAKAILNYEKEFDLIITLSKGASYRAHAALLLCPQFHYKWLAFMHDPYPFHLYPPPYNWTEAGHQQKVAFFKEVSEKAAFSSFPSLLLKEWMGKYFPNFLKTGIILPHQDIDYGFKKEAETPSYFHPTKFSLLHAGNMLGYRNPFHLIEAYKLFLEREPSATTDAQLIFLGPAEYHEPAFTEACNNVDSIYKSEGYVAFNEVYHLQQHTSVNVIIEAEATISPFLPGKFPHCIKANKPILLLSPAKSECNRLLGEEYPYSSLPNDLLKIVEILRVLYNKWKEDNNSLSLDRADLNKYFSSQYLGQELLKNVSPS